MEPTLMVALKAVSTIKRGLDHATLLDQIDVIEHRLDDIGAHLAQDQVARLRAGFAHLDTAQTVSSSRLRAEELAKARGIFAELSERRGGDELTIRHQWMTWRHISALGHIGNYYYFLLNAEENVALQHAYSAIERYPIFALSVVPRELISESARSLVPPNVRDPEKLRVGLSVVKKILPEQRRQYRLDMAWRVPAAAAYVVGGFAVSPITPSMAARGVQAAVGLLAASKEGLLPPKVDVQGYLKEIAEWEKLLSPITEEAALRRAQLEQLSRGPRPQLGSRDLGLARPD